ncbi:MAG: hypothetical protein CMB99_09810 [Flavobacteriaceae bacterium]|nr:hypothetical protein [Flavobacteriaceae bacterium]|tara:strand:+ start:371963 stop:372400 length:438 start_codon:yes stop_codon:yes gene_type:complete
MKEFLRYAKQQFSVSKKLIFLYVVIYFLWGLGMNEFGSYMEIARFTYWWQVITVYLVYMIPISLLLRGLPFHAQYAYGLVAMGLLEFGGYLMETPYAYPNNLMDQYLNIRNFSLGMALFFALYFPAGNALVNFVYKQIFGKNAGA